MRGGRKYIASASALIVATIIFLVPFAFIIVTAMKTKKESSELRFSWPTEIALLDNIITVFETRDFMLVTAFINSTILTVASVSIMVILAAMVGFILQRRPGRMSSFVNMLVLSGLIIPPAVVPTIWVLQSIGLFKTLPGLIFIEVAFGMSFCILLFRSFISTIPKELDEAAILDGSGPIRLFFKVILPLLKPVSMTVIIVQSVAVFNDFVNPLYFFPGADNATVQLTLYNFQSQFSTSWNLLFTNILLITIPPLIAFLFFNRQIVAGMTAGSVK